MPPTGIKRVSAPLYCSRDHFALLFHDWWAEAPQSAIDEYYDTLMALPGLREFVADGYLPEPLTLDDLAPYEPGTVGAAYRSFIVDNGLEANLGRNYRKFNEQLHADGMLDRLPDEMSYMMLRGFQIHDFLHVMTGFSSKPLGELAQAAFHYAQLQFPYHAMRMAVTAGHVAFVAPKGITATMDAQVAGWTMGRAAENLHFIRWEDELATPLDEMRERTGIDVAAHATF